MPDGHTIQIGGERLALPEYILDPTDLEDADPKCLPSTTMILTAIENAGPDLRRELQANMILAGGNSCYKGLQKRLQLNIQSITPPTHRTKIIAQGMKERQISSWMGGSILGSLSSFHEMWVSKAEYEDYGPSIVQKKCP